VVGSAGITAGVRRRVAAAWRELSRVAPARPVTELAVGRRVRVSLGGAPGATGLLHVDVIAVATCYLRAVGHVMVTVLTTCQSPTYVTTYDHRLWQGELTQ